MAHAGDELRFVLARLLKLLILVLDLVEQPHVLDRDHRLIGERGGEFDLTLAERVDGATRQHKYPGGRALAQEKHTKNGVISADFLVLGHPVFRIGLSIENVNWSALKQHAADRALPSSFPRR